MPDPLNPAALAAAWLATYYPGADPLTRAALIDLLDTAYASGAAAERTRCAIETQDIASLSLSCDDGEALAAAIRSGQSAYVDPSV